MADPTDYTPLPDDVRERYEQVIPDDQSGYLSQLIDEAVIVLGAQVGDLGTYPPATVKMLLIRAVMRVLRNPEGFTAESEGTYNYNLSQRVASGSIWFPNDEVAMLVPTSLGVGSIRTRVPWHRRPWGSTRDLW